MAVTWVASANVVVCEVFILVVTMVEQTLGTGETAHALDPLPQHIRTVPARSGSVFCLRVKFVAVDAALLQSPRLPCLSTSGLYR